jgi:hypothetical protein
MSNRGSSIVNRTAIAMALTGVAAVGRGALMSQGAPSTYQVPWDLAFFDPFFGCPTAIADDVSNYVFWSTPEKRIAVRIQEVNPSSGQWEYKTYVYSTSYRVLDVAFQQGGVVLYVSGVQINGPAYADVIEKWEFPPLGSHAFTVEGGTTPIGVPRGSFSGSASVIGGASGPPGGGVPAPQPVPERTLLYSKLAGGHINRIAADPEGRFLMLHNYTTGDVSTIDLAVESPSPVLAFSAAQYPALAATRGMFMHDVPGIGRVCRLTPTNVNGAYPNGTTEAAMLVDAENDGIFDAVIVHNEIDITRELTPYGNSADWGSVVNFGWDWRVKYQ